MNTTGDYARSDLQRRGTSTRHVARQGTTRHTHTSMYGIQVALSARAQPSLTHDCPISHTRTATVASV
jgi:hypothetical protein